MRWWLIALLPALLAAAESGPALLDDGFEAAKPGAPPPNWVCFADPGQTIEVVSQPALGQRSLHFVRGGGSVWKPMVSGSVGGLPESGLRLEYDVAVAALADTWDGAFHTTLRGDGNRGVVSVAVGGPGGVAVPDEHGRWLPLDFRLQPGAFAHVVIVTDPIRQGAAGAFDLSVSQGDEQLTVPNIPFRRMGSYPTTWWYSPTFQQGGGTPQRPREAWLDNVRVSVAQRAAP